MFPDLSFPPPVDYIVIISCHLVFLKKCFLASVLHSAIGLHLDLFKHSFPILHQDCNIFFVQWTNVFCAVINILIY